MPASENTVVAPVVRQKSNSDDACNSRDANISRFAGKRKVGNSSNNKSRDNKSGIQAFMVQRFVDKSMVIKANSQERNINVTARRQTCYFPNTAPLKLS